MRAGNHGFNVAIHEDYADNLPMTEVIPQDLSRAVLNVMNNACYAVWRKAEKAGEGYSPEINVKVESLPMQEGGVGGGLLISISDNGEGMSDEVKERLFENFFTTKPIGHGTGLGMGITRDIIENKHGGKLTFTSQEGVGTTFTFEIPFKRS
jgi:signal transduction histidine kinase